MKAHKPHSVTPQAVRLVRVFGEAVLSGDTKRIDRARFNLFCHIHRAEMKAGAITEPTTKEKRP